MGDSLVARVEEAFAAGARTFLLSIGVVLLAAAASGFLVWRKVQKLDLIEVLKTRE